MACQRHGRLGIDDHTESNVACIGWPLNCRIILVAHAYGWLAVSSTNLSFYADFQCNSEVSCPRPALKASPTLHLNHTHTVIPPRRSWTCMEELGWDGGIGGVLGVLTAGWSDGIFWFHK